MCILHNKTGNVTKEGYAKVSFYGKQVLLHRLVYSLINGMSLDEIKGKLVRHSCDVPSCIDPNHLVLGTHKDNMCDMVTRKRTKTNRRFSDEDIRDMRLMYVNGEASQKELAGMFHVSVLTVWRILNRKTYYEI